VGKYIPVEPEKWAEMVKAQAEVARLEALTSEMDKTINASQAECRRLKAEVERLNNESDILQKCCEHQKNRIERLKAEIERLTKAGDKAFSLWSSGDETDADNFKEAIWVWTVAKKGGQP
jgi:uncharacterized small protein (DUF1192 family)